MKRNRILCLLTVLLTLCCLMGAADGNLFTNVDFTPDEQGSPSNWEISDINAFTTVTDAQLGTLAQLTTQAGDDILLTQVVPVESEQIYCIRFSARVVSGSGSAYVQVEECPGYRSAAAVDSAWTSIELYGLTSPEQVLLPLNFVAESTSAETLVVQFAQLEMTPATTVPEDADYVYLYDRNAYLQSYGDEQSQQQANLIQGVVPSFLLWALYGICIAIYLRRGAATVQYAAPKRAIWMLLGLGLAFSSVLAISTPGHPTDITNFSAWAQHAAEVGLPDFYISGMWADYPPGYIYVLYVIGLIGRVLGLSSTSAAFHFLVKLPAIFADLGCAYIVYRLAWKQWSERTALWLAALMAFNPMAIVDSAVWGQMDSVLALLTLWCLYLYVKDKKPFCAAVFVLGVLVKPQMLMFGPLLAVAYIKDIVHAPKKGLRELALSICFGIGTLVLVALPFTLKQNPLWLWEKYTSAAGLYPYATVNAFNLYALLGMNWVADTTPVLFGLSAKGFGTMMIVAVCVFVGILYWRKSDRRVLFSLSALLAWGIFAFSHAMHERYLFPAILLFVIAYIYERDWRYLVCSGWATGVTLLNSLLVLLNDSSLLMGFQFETCMVALLNLCGFGYACYVWISANRTRKTVPLQPANGQEDPVHDFPVAKPIELQAREEEAKFTLRSADRCGEKMVRWDYLIMGVITVVYACVALINLGSTQVPESYWRPLQKNETVVVDLGQEQELSAVYYYPGVGYGRMSFSVSLDGQNYTQPETVQVEEGQMYTWQTYELVLRARYIRVCAVDAKLLINEMAFLDAQGQPVPVASVQNLNQNNTGNAQALCDEPDLVDLHPSYMTEMYFDEIYHARTAFEHLHGFAPYENTHPPLGKVFIMLGIMLFGMNPFGWRIVGTLFGIGMLPLLYVFAKRLFKDTRCAALACFLFAVDGMHFAQTRIATIDVYGVFFIIAMCYFMYRYWQMNFYVDGLKKTFVPLGLCGIMFGLGAASKWIGLYAGVGLAVAFFYTLYRRYRERAWALQRLQVTQDADERALCERVAAQFWPYAIKTCVFCVGFFILIPIAIYLLSYLPYFLCAEKPYSLSDVWGVQTYMFNYHSQLTATHPYQSPWYTWPLVIRPIWYYAGSDLPEGMMQSIASFGNPIVWWVGLFSTIFVIVLLCRRRIAKEDRSTIGFILISLGAAFLPWVLITRATFIYHYFASVPFIILLTAYLIKLSKTRRFPKWAWALCILSLAVFCWFYPVYAGVTIDRAFAMSYMRWLPTWWFF